MKTDVSLQSNKLASVDPDWDRFLGDVGADIVQTSMWGVSKQAIGQTPILTKAIDGGGRIVGGALAIVRPVALGIRVAYVANGPVVRSADPNILHAVVNDCLAAARSHGCKGVIVQPSGGDLERAAALEGLASMPSLVAVSPSATLTIDLRASDEDLLAAMSATRRRHIRRYANQEIAVELSEDIEAFHTLHSATAHRRGFTKLSLRYLEAQWSALRPFGAVHIAIASHAGRPLAASWITSFAGKATYRLTGWDADMTGNLHVNEILQWRQMQLLREIGVKTYDLGGIDRAVAEDVLAGRPIDRKVERTPTFFKLGFSKNVVLLGQPKLLVFSKPVGWLARQISTRLPTRAVGRLAQRLRSA